jgi:hypothetical protein|uniref:Plastid light harvesting protein n=1 Tax=Octactis speculum TaxID=3111310 RepID=A0A7S2DJ63_9STRA|mmetsp:Transcript_49913/g.67920  ORF Transcript_49913/g.67920 Transcript_49913/m.67920 type:complete len:271 (+) Transcript_49913:24-836(+)|eukprot:CAMPEP_0185742730 /NCGR_PEP_ID=MMETSP1174-20130828/101_1 /TAXON_ID=35687 /ORGANISM="Dictyocha speculum, Strain CCMP1381" /LENGTH=270 /DNA_ID=CAMNT_0028414809 /DNA_START=24 /DNA_END=836 /DNA_ORIENTATION=+
MNSLQTVILALALGSAAAFTPVNTPQRAAVATKFGKADLIELAESNTDGLSPGFWDPLGVSDIDFWGLGQEGTIGYLRHAEIKHGRVAMAAFLGYCAQCTDLVKGPHTLDPYRGYIENVSPQEQWDNIPLIAKLQIITLVGMLESYGEGAGCEDGEYTHYTKGGLPGYYPPIKGKGAVTPITLNLFDPLDWFAERSPEELERGRRVEVNNGRLAMIGIGGVLSASKGLVVPPLNSLPIPQYDGDVMAPFSADFSLGGHTFNRVIDWAANN